MSDMPDEIYASIIHLWRHEPIQSTTTKYTRDDIHQAVVDENARMKADIDRMVPINNDLATENAKLVNQRDELLDVLQDALNVLEWYKAEHPQDASPADDEFLERANKAIANEQGGCDE